MKTKIICKHCPNIRVDSSIVFTIFYYCRIQGKNHSINYAYHEGKQDKSCPRIENDKLKGVA